MGPSFKGLYGSERRLEGGRVLRADGDYVRRALQEPGADVAEGYPAVMPAYPQLGEAEIEAIVEWLKTVR